MTVINAFRLLLTSMAGLLCGWGLGEAITGEWSTKSLFELTFVTIFCVIIRVVLGPLE